MPRASHEHPQPAAEPTRSAHGDEADLFGRYHAALVSQLDRHLGGEREVAEEAAAFAWLQLLRHQPDRTQIRGWLFTVAKREGYAILRRRGRQHDLDDLPGPSGADPVEQLERQQLLRLIERLPARQRLALGLYARGFSYKEICAATGKTYTWVNRHITEGRARIRELAAGEP